MTKEYKAFSEALEKVLSVSHSEIKRREMAEMEARKKAAYGRKRKGHKPPSPDSPRAHRAKS